VFEECRVFVWKYSVCMFTCSFILCTHGMLLYHCKFVCVILHVYVCLLVIKSVKMFSASLAQVIVFKESFF
jgi:hypothetical protein